MRPFTGILLVTAATLIQLGSFAESAKILFFFGHSTYSQRIGVWPLIEQLADRGHSITFLSPYPSKNPQPNPKVTEYIPKPLQNWVESWDLLNSSMYNIRSAGEMDNSWISLPSRGIEMCENLMGDPEHIKWLKNSHFDLVFVDSIVNECAYGMAYKFKAKIIVFNTCSGLPWYSDPFGYPDESSSIPDMMFHYPQSMNLFQRIVSTLVPLYFKGLREFHYFPKLEAIFKEKLELTEFPSFSDIERNVSLLFVNNHFAEDYARPFPPNVISIGGMHCSDKPQELSKELDEFIKKGGNKGFIYMSFGTMVQLSTFPQNIKNMFFNTLKKLKNVQIIWKTEMERPVDLPDNVFIGNWMPQQALLAHPKIKAFITHAGLFGIQEAICTSVPLIAFPIFAEQDYNAEKIHSREIGIRVEITTVTEEQLLQAVNKVLTDDKYARNMKRISKVFRDRPEKPVDTAVWWTEYVLRHDDMRLIKPQSIYQSWWKKRNLDVWAVLFGLILILLLITFTIVKLSFTFIFCRSGSKKLKRS